MYDKPRVHREWLLSDATEHASGEVGVCVQLLQIVHRAARGLVYYQHCFVPCGWVGVCEWDVELDYRFRGPQCVPSQAMIEDEEVMSSITDAFEEGDDFQIFDD